MGVINIGHPRNGNKYIVNDSFSYTRKDAVKKFIDGSGCSWRYWKDKYNFKVVKAESIIVTMNQGTGITTH